MSSNLNAPALVGGQANPETTVNDAVGVLDAALTESVTVDLTNSATISVANYRACIRILVTPAGVAKTLTLRAIKRLVVIQNDGGNDISITLGSTTLTLADGSSTIVYTDGTTNGLVEFAVGGGGGGGGGTPTNTEPFDLAAHVPGLPIASQVVFRFNVLREFSWPAGLTASLFSAGTAATATTVFDIEQNGTPIGSLSFAAAGTVPTVTFSAQVDFAVNDLIEVIAPATPDATLANISFNFAGSRATSLTLVPFDLNVFIPGKPGAAAIVLRFNVVRAFLWRASVPGSIFNAGVASAASKVFTVKRNGSSVGTITFSTSSTGTDSFASDVFFDINDVITIEAPAAQDTALENVSLNFLGSR